MKVTNRKANSDRVKIQGALADAEVDKTYIISAKVYAETAAENVIIGGYTGGTWMNSVSDENKFDIPEKTWTDIRVEYTHAENVTDIAIETVSTKTPAKTLYIDNVKVMEKTDTDSAEAKVIYEENFDDMTILADIIATGGGSSLGHFTIETGQDKTTGTGNYLKQGSRKSNSYRVKFIDALKDAEVGKTYTISAWIYAQNGADNVIIGAYTSDQWMKAVSQEDYFDLEKNVWTEVKVEYTHTDASITQISIETYGASTVASPLYIDDITITEVIKTE